MRDRTACSWNRIGERSVSIALRSARRRREQRVVLEVDVLHEIASLARSPP
jgi:hypothetical protein